MKILLVANKDITLYLFRKEFIEELVKLKHDVYILCPEGDKLEYFINLGVNVMYYPLDRRGKNIFREIKVIRNLYKYIRKIKPDYVFTYTIKPNIYVGLISRILKFRFIPTITGLGSSIIKKSIIRRIIIALYKISFKKCYVAVFQNLSNLDWFKMNINNEMNSILVNGSGVNLERYYYVDILDNTKTIFLFLGRIMKEKGVEEFFEAAKFLKEKYKESIEFRMAGFYEDNYESKVKLLDEKGIIKYLGFIDDSKLEIINCTALVLPSYHEGLSNVLLEAQSIGRPVIATNIPGCYETFIDNYSGYLVNVCDVNDLIEKLEKYHLLPMKNKIIMSLNSRSNVEKKFDRRNIVKDYLNLIS